MVTPGPRPHLLPGVPVSRSLICFSCSGPRRICSSPPSVIVSIGPGWPSRFVRGRPKRPAGARRPSSKRWVTRTPSRPLYGRMEGMPSSRLPDPTNVARYVRDRDRQRWRRCVGSNPNATPTSEDRLRACRPRVGTALPKRAPESSPSTVECLIGRRHHQR